MQRTEKTAGRRRRHWTDVLAFLWGLAEATVFFIVPDVLITHAALRGWTAGLRTALFAVAGALPGGLIMYLLGAHWPQEMRALLDLVPAVSSQMIDGVADQIARFGYLAVFLGPLWGAPYKLYAALAPQGVLSLPLFLLLSLPARLLRFVLLALLAAGIGQWLRQLFGRRAALIAWAAAWTVFYAAWFALMPN